MNFFPQKNFSITRIFCLSPLRENVFPFPYLEEFFFPLPSQDFSAFPNFNGNFIYNVLISSVISLKKIVFHLTDSGGQERGCNRGTAIGRAVGRWNVIGSPGVLRRDGWWAAQLQLELREKAFCRTLGKEESTCGSHSWGLAGILGRCQLAMGADFQKAGMVLITELSLGNMHF